jgi:hypothetical protein
MAMKSAISSIGFMTGRLVSFLSFAVFTMWDTFDVRIVLFFGGLGLLFYGLFLYLPWVSFSVCGVILMAIGWLMGGKR